MYYIKATVSSSDTAEDIALNVTDDNAIEFIEPTNTDNKTKDTEKKETKQIRWHQRLGHIGMKSMKLLKESNINGADKLIVNETLPQCDGCAKGKMHRKSFGRSTANPVSQPMERWHADVIGPVHTYTSSGKKEAGSIDGSKYMLVMVDEYSRKVFKYLVKEKSEIPKKIIEVITQKQVETGKKLKQFHSDGATEFINDTLKQWFATNGTQQTASTPATPQHNGIAERANRKIIEMTRAMLHHASLPLKFWPLAASAAVSTINRCVSTATKQKKCADELFVAGKYSIKHFRVFGCNVMYHVSDQDRSKFDAKASKAVFVGYADSKIGYRLYDLNEKKIVIKAHQDVSFDETNFSNAHELTKEQNTELEVSGKNDKQKVEQEYDSDPDMDERDDKEYKPTKESTKATTDEQTESKSSDGLRRSNRVRKQANKPGFFRIEDTDVYGYHEAALAVIEVNDEPKSFKEAQESKEADKWMKSAIDEIQSHIHNGTWRLVRLPKDRTAIPCKWVFKKKINKEGKVERYKARLVAKGFRQIEGIDYDEVFAPTAKYKSLRIVLAIANELDYEIVQMDVETAFLNATIDEEIYMEQPEGFHSGDKNEVLQLLKAIYGTKQAPNRWNKTLNEFISRKLKYKRCQSDPCVYVRMSKNGNVMIIIVFVDDIISAYHTNDEQEWQQFKNRFMKEYKMKDLGNAEWILGMRITRDRKNGTLTIDQEVYVKKVLNEFNMQECKTVSTPEAPERLSADDQPKTTEEQEEMKTQPYRSLVGSLMYAAIASRIDIAHAVNIGSRYMNNPGKKHLVAMKKVLRYLRGTTDKKLKYKASGKNEFTITAYSDADWAGDVDERKSTTGFITKVNNNIISWNSKKQPTVALSSCEAEYYAVSDTLKELKWIHQFLMELNCAPVRAPMIIFCDNQSAINLCKHDANHSRTKHIDIKHHFIRQAVESNEVIVEWVNTSEQEADILTKPLGKQLFEQLRSRIMV